jgi:hypothetical protein
MERKKASGSLTLQEISLQQWSFTAMTSAVDNFLQKSFGIKISSSDY